MSKEIKTIEWKNGSLRIIDQTKLPQKIEYRTLKNYKSVIAAIKDMKIRGAPAIGVAGAFALVLASRSIKGSNIRDFFFRLESAKDEVLGSRPTAVNLAWGIQRLMAVANSNRNLPADSIRGVILNEATKMLEEDLEANKRIGKNGASLVRPGSSILTYCNAGSLATVGYGTALGVIRFAHAAKKVKMVYAPETRPKLQGARLTSFELKQEGIPFKLITDNMTGTLMRQGKIDLVIVGADRIAANGDVANKIGTYVLAVLAKEHGLPFYVAAPISTIDPNINSGEEIPIETRSDEEVTGVAGSRIAPAGIDVYNPAFDVTPRQYVTAIITEEGVVRPPYRENIKAVLRKHKHVR